MNKKAEIDMIDVLLYASAPYTGKNEIEAYNAADPEIRLSAKARKRIQKRLRLEREYKEQHERYSPVWEISKRIAIVVLVVLSLSFVSVMSVEAVRVALWEAILEWREESIHIWYESTVGEPEVLTEILEYKEPRGIGEEYVRYEGNKTKYTYAIEYESEDYVLSYSQGLVTNKGIYVSNEETVVEEIKVNNQQGIITEYEVYGHIMKRIIWTDGKYLFYLSGNVSSDYLLRLAESVS